MIKNKLRSAVWAALAMTASVNVQAADILDYVPSDTAFFMGNSTPMPVEAAFPGVPNYKDFLNAMGGAHVSGNGSDRDTDLFLALYNEYIDLTGEPHETLKKYGVSEPVDFAIYMSGATPVMRFRLADTKQFERALSTFEQDNGLVPEGNELNGVYYRRYQDATSGSGGESEPTLVIAIDQDMAVITLDYDNASVLTRALSAAPGGTSMSDTGSLDALNSRWGYSGELTFFVDMQAMLEQYASTNGSMRQDLTQLLPVNEVEEFFAAADSPQCVDEMRTMTSVVPRFVGGYRKVVKSGGTLELVGHAAVDVDYPELMQSLVKLRGHIPTELVTAETMMAFGLGFDVSQLMPVLTELSQLAQNADYQCEHFASFGDDLREGLQGMTMGAGMFAGMAQSFKGLSLGLYSTNEASARKVNNAEDPFGVGALDMLFLVSSDNPQALLQTTQMMPQTADIVIPDNGVAVSLKRKLMGMTGMAVDVFAAQRGDHIAVYQGAESTRVAEQLSGSTATSNGLMYFRVNVKEFEGLIMEQVKNFMMMSGNLTGEQDEEINRFMESYPAGSSDFAMDITAQGLEFLTYTTIDQTR